MIDRRLPNLPTPELLALPTPSPLPRHHDERLMFSALRRWRDSAEGLGELAASVPTSHDINARVLTQPKTDPQQVLNECWRDFWSARAAGTAVSRQSRAIELYRRHVEAAADWSFAHRTISAQQHQTLLSIIDSGESTPNPQPIRAEQLALVLSNQSRIKLTGAWVISLEQSTDGGLLLYLPSRPIAIASFEQRSALEQWLARQALVPQGLPSGNLRIEYTAHLDPMSVGASDLFAHYQQAQVNALRNGTLALSDEAYPKRRNSPVIASPPRLETSQSQGDEQPLFGSLYADIPWSVRETALNRQRNALDALIQAMGDGADLQPLHDAQQTLEKAELDADAAAATLLQHPRPATFDRTFTALLDAHRAGLKAEASLQRALKQLDEDEYRQLLAVLDAADTGWVSASLSVAKVTDEQTTHALHGAFIVTVAAALADADSPHSVLLYWPGAGGGLQRFANRRELERVMFKIAPQDKVAALHVHPLSGDALEHGLKQLTSDFETGARAIADDAPQRAEQLQSLRANALAALQVPVDAARNLVWAHRLEQDRSVALAAHLPDWLDKLSMADRGELKALIEAYLPAMARSHELLTIALEPRNPFTRKHLQARLRKDFSLKGAFDVQLDIPDTVTWETRYSAGPTGPVPTSVMVASPQRSRMSLEALAQLNIDSKQSVQQDPLSQRMVLMHRQITADDDKERVRLLNGLTPTYLRKVIPELDLPNAYERRIIEAFRGSASETSFVREHRRECLIEPWRLMLKLQGECARLQKQINRDDLTILGIAIDASTPADWRVDDRRIVLLPARLTVGGKDTPDEGPVTLSGVTFIQELVSGTTLLYLPDSPDGQFLRRYDNLEIARKALFNLCLQDRMLEYLAGRALQGDVRAHESRINEASLRHFDAMIGIGTPWPASTSLAAHLLDAHMGRLIIAHRDTSRSNATLQLERYALEGPRAFNYIKMALGMLPFVGTAIALYDAWTAANQATVAFLRGEVGDGVAQLRTVLLCLIDAAMDLLPGEAAVSSLAPAARQLTRARQLRALTVGKAAWSAPSTRHARHLAARFAGYEYERPISLWPVQPATLGLYRHVYRHADGDFIVRQGRIFQVQLSNDSRQWRLLGNSRKTYQQPIALDESGRWDTWFGVYGTTFEGGGRGGGNLPGHLANALDPLWPEAIRQRLPRWWVDRTFRRHHELTETADSIALKIDAQVKHTDARLAAYDASPERVPALMDAAEAACIADIELGNRYYQTLTELLPLTHGNKRRVLVEFQSNGALLLTDRYRRRLIFDNHRVQPLLDRADDLTETLDATPVEALTKRLVLLEDIRKLRLDILKSFDTIEARRGDLNHWYQRITLGSDRAQMTAQVNELNTRLSESNILYLRTGHLLESVTRYDSTSDLSWFLLQNQTQLKRARVDRALFTQFSLPEVTATRAQRNQILLDCIEQYRQFRRDMKAWTASYPQHFHLEAVSPLLDALEKMTERARKGLDLSPPAAPSGQRTKKVFLTENDQWLIGTERTEPATGQRQYTLTGQDGRVEIWEPASDGKSRLLNPQPQLASPAPRSLESLVTEARKRLNAQPAYETRVQSYASQDMLPVDLEHMMLSEANELTLRARSIEELAPQNALIAQLRDKAAELTATGRALRTRQSLKTRAPTDGMLEDLIGQGVVEVRKVSPMKNLGKRRDGRTDHMQEYEIWDLSQTPEKVVWYAHFHYAKASAAFSAFEKAHLKLPEHRFLTHAHNADLPYADIGKKSAVLPYFETL